MVKHADWLQFGELLSVPKEALDKERWLHLLAAYDPDGSGEIPVSEVVTDALQPVAVELITCLARTVHTLSAKVLPHWLYSTWIAVALAPSPSLVTLGNPNPNPSSTFTLAL